MNVNYNSRSVLPHLRILPSEDGCLTNNVTEKIISCPFPGIFYKVFSALRLLGTRPSNGRVEPSHGELSDSQATVFHRGRHRSGLLPQVAAVAHL